MTRTAAVSFLIALSLIIGCGPSLRHITPDSPVSGLLVQVHEFDVVADASNCPLQGAGTLVAQTLVQALQAAGVDARVVSPSAAPAHVVLEGQITQCDRGKRGLRYLAGPFGGKRAAARFGVKGRADGTVAGEFGAKRRAGWGLFGGNGNTLLNNCLEAAVYDVAEMVITGKYQDHPEDTAFRANVLVHP